MEIKGDFFQPILKLIQHSMIGPKYLPFIVMGLNILVADLNQYRTKTKNCISEELIM